MAKEFSLKNTALSMKRAKVEMHKPGYKFSVEKRIEVISTWLALGNLRQTSVLCGVSYDLCCKWRVQPWWQQMQAEIEAARKHKVDNKLNKIVDKALGAIEDRLDNGDYVYNQKSGEVTRKPVSIKEARGVANDLMQRQIALSKLEVETQHASSANTVKDQIALLAEEFAKFNTRRTIEVLPNAISNSGSSMQKVQSSEPEDASEIEYTEQDSEILSSDDMFDMREEGDETPPTEQQELLAEYESQELSKLDSGVLR